MGRSYTVFMTLNCNDLPVIYFKLPFNTNSQKMILTHIEEIGPGGFGIVDKVKDEKGNIYARKTFMINNSTFPRKLENNARDRFKREAKYQRSITHSNIVPVLFEDLDSMPPYYVMPLAVCSLQTDIEKDRSLGGRFLECLMDIIAGLEELHSMKIYHRDLKPANVLKFKKNDDEEYYAIGDFGLIAIGQTQISSLTQTGMRMGSDFYTAPEIVADLKKASIQSDIFSLGCILHDFVGTRNRIPCYEITEQGPFSAIMLGCTRKNPSRRFKNVAAVRDALLTLGDINFNIQTEEETVFSEILAKDIPPDESEWNRIIDFVDDKFGSADAISILWKIRIGHIESLTENFPDMASRLGIVYARWIRDYSFRFSECDALAARLELFVQKCDIRAQAEGLMAMLYMGTRHNRWYVERKFVTLIGKDIAPDLAKCLSVEIRVDDNIACAAFSHLKRSISYEISDAHPVIFEAIKSICT